MVRGVAQWFGCRSLAGEIFLSCMHSIHGWQVTTSWIHCPLWMSQQGPTQTFIPAGSVSE